MNKLTKEQVIEFHKQLINRFGGSHGLRDENALDSALGAAFQTFDGKDLHKTDIDKISSICYSLIANHAFIDGNKRIGVFVMLILLAVNHYDLQYSQTELISFGLNIASRKCKQKDVRKWIEQHLSDNKI